MIRIGHGFDIHRLEAGHSLVLSGVEIEHPLGTVAHSDGDVVLHAVIDALVGAACMGDIGTLFSDSDMSFKDIDSRVLLRTTLAKICPLIVSNVDITIIAERPRLADYIPQMRHNIIQDVGCDKINIKATTTEGLGAIGAQMGIACHAVVLLQEDD